jgi:hypothetical protein
VSPLKYDTVHGNLQVHDSIPVLLTVRPVHTPNGDAGVNAGLVVGDKSVLVIDTFENEAPAKAC